MELLETLNRTAKIALDDGSASSIEDAINRFRSFDLQIVVGTDVRHNRALQAAIATLLNAAPRTFMGNITVVGDVNSFLEVGWYKSKTIADVANLFGVTIAKSTDSVPSIVVGLVNNPPINAFSIRLSCYDKGFRLSPDDLPASSLLASICTGIASAGAALNELFQYLYFRRPWAGLRSLEFLMPQSNAKIESYPTNIWLIGLGHLGQATLWTLGLTADEFPYLPTLTLQDYDVTTISSVSTGLLVRPEHLGKMKVDVAADAMGQLGFACQRRYSRVELNMPLHDSSEVCAIAVDSFGFRRQLDKINGPRIVEAGIGNGIEGFTKIQLHLLPGRRKAADIWSGADPKATRIISIAAPAYQDLLRRNGDECGTTQLAGRSIATPFIGAFAGAMMCSLLPTMSRCNDFKDAWNIDVNHL